MTDELVRLQERVEAGTVWLAEHDPGSRFHLWFEAGLTPVSRMPGHEGDVDLRADWRAYFGARQTFEKLDRELARLEGRRPTVVGTIQWQPAKERR